MSWCEVYFLRQRHNKRSGWRKGSSQRQMLQPSTSSGYSPPLPSVILHPFPNDKADSRGEEWRIHILPHKNPNVDFFLQAGTKPLTAPKCLQPINSKMSRLVRRFGFRNLNPKETYKEIPKSICLILSLLPHPPVFCWKSHLLLISIFSVWHISYNFIFSDYHPCAIGLVPWLNHISHNMPGH